MSLRFRRSVLMACCGLLVAAAAQASVLNHAAAFRWQGYVGTNLPLSSFYEDDHSVVVRFMAQYPAAYQGPMFTTSIDGNYLIGLGDFSYETEGPKLQVTFGGRSAFFSGQNVPTDLVAGKWNTVIVVKESGKYRVWLNGQLLARDGCSTGCTSQPEGNDPVGGNVRFGRKNASSNAQFYGFLDDVEVYGRALDAFERGLINLLPRLSGNESGVLRAWTFDDAMPNGAPNPPAVHAGSFAAPAYRTLVSEQRDAAFDAGLLPPPTLTVDLPFAKGVAWKVSQGFQGSASHHGYAAFAWDFVRNTSSNADTCGAKLVAAAPGTLFHGWDWGGDLDPSDDLDDPIDGYNDLKIELGTPGEYLRYLHVLTGSIRDAFGITDLPPGIPPFAVAKGEKVAEAGTRGPNNCHLHLSYGNGTVTVPLGYDYERWDASLGSWIAVQNGMPRQGQVIRRP
jgi:concanavalin A-like lectin/glucanase superfamily protein